jgi:hypothetical protein
MGGVGGVGESDEAKTEAREQRIKYKPRTETRTTLSNPTRRQAGGFEELYELRAHYFIFLTSFQHNAPRINLCSDVAVFFRSFLFPKPSGPQD